jgi:flagellin-like hook-associated protein FlgL
MKAQTDVPQGIILESLFASGQVGATGYFDYVGQDRSNGATASDKPTTEYLRTNKDLPSPDAYSPVSVGTTSPIVALASLMDDNTANNYMPDYVLVGGTSIYAPATDWNISKWVSLGTYREGDVIFDTTTTPGSPSIYQFNSLVKGDYSGGDYVQGSYVKYGGESFKAVSIASSTDIPLNATNLFDGVPSHEAGMAVLASDGTINVANVSLRGTFDASKIYERGDVISTSTGQYASFANKHHGEWKGETLNLAANESFLYGGVIYTADSAITGLALSDIDVTTTQVTGISYSDLEFEALTTDVTASVKISADSATDETYFSKSHWQIGYPNTDSSVKISRTNEFTNTDNSSIWTKTHYSHLNGKTVGTSYTRGDNIYYQGKNYIYTSHLDSDNALYSSPEDGYTEFSELLRLGAIQEVPMYVDTIGGGGAPGAPSDIYFRRNQDLQFVDRLPGSGEVRTTNMARRTDAPLPPGDEIFNSPDDAFYGGLQAGNDGIYGTMDDFYESTADIALAQKSAHLDADADNNKDLLNLSNNLEDFSVADFVDYIQTLANVRAVNGGTMSRLNYAGRILEENEINLGAAASRIMDTDMATESTKMARQNVLMQAAASMVTQANALNNVVLSLLQ